MNRDILEFVTFCIGAVANSLSLPRRKVYKVLKQSGALDNYIIKCYDVLHTFSRENIVDDIVGYLKHRDISLA